MYIYIYIYIYIIAVAALLWCGVNPQAQNRQTQIGGLTFWEIPYGPGNATPWTWGFHPLKSRVRLRQALRSPDSQLADWPQGVRSRQVSGLFFATVSFQNFMFVFAA